MIQVCVCVTPTRTNVRVVLRLQPSGQRLVFPQLLRTSRSLLLLADGDLLHHSCRRNDTDSIQTKEDSPRDMCTIE